MSDPVKDNSNYSAAGGLTPRPAAPLSGLARLPDIVLRSGGLPINRPPRLLTPVYGNLRRSFSGITWYLAQAGIAEATLEGAFTLNSEERFNPSLAFTGALWKLQRRMRGRTHGGFKFVPAFHDILWSQYIERLAGMAVINNFQIFGDLFLKRFIKLGITPYFFIEGTLTEYLYGYGAVHNREIDAGMADRAIAMEREEYAHASRIITMSRASARHLVEVYNVPPARVAVVIPGANIDDGAVPPPSLHKGWVGEQFTLERVENSLNQRIPIVWRM